MKYFFLQKSQVGMRFFERLLYRMDQLISQTKAMRSFQWTQIASFHRMVLNLLEKNANVDGGKNRIGSNYARFNLFPSHSENLSQHSKRNNCCPGKGARSALNLVMNTIYSTFSSVSDIYAICEALLFMSLLIFGSDNFVICWCCKFCCFT